MANQAMHAQRLRDKSTSVVSLTASQVGFLASLTSAGNHLVAKFEGRYSDTVRRSDI
ncbi:MAG: hypothetical protein ABGZ17_13385 [Planctomycetaceae bacterium]